MRTIHRLWGNSVCASNPYFTSVVTTFYTMQVCLSRCAYQIAGALWCTFLLHRFFQQSATAAAAVSASFHFCHCIWEGFCLSNICSNAHVFYSHKSTNNRERKKNMHISQQIQRHHDDDNDDVWLIQHKFFFLFLLYSLSLSRIFNVTFLLLLTLRNQMYILALG